MFFSNVNDFDKFIKSIKEPDDLLCWMSNIEYGYQDKKGKLYSGEFSGQNYYFNMRTQSPKEVFKSKTATCISQAEFARYIFERKALQW